MNVSADQSQVGLTVKSEKSLRKVSNFVRGQPDLTRLCFVDDIKYSSFSGKRIFQCDL